MREVLMNHSTIFITVRIVLKKGKMFPKTQKLIFGFLLGLGTYSKFIIVL